MHYISVDTWYWWQLKDGVKVHLKELFIHILHVLWWDDLILQKPVTFWEFNVTKNSFKSGVTSDVCKKINLIIYEYYMNVTSETLVSAFPAL